jgi:hypothetical protein
LKKLLLILLFLCPVFSQAQTSVYHPFPEDSAKWCAYSCTLDFNPWTNQSTNQLSGKVLINSNWYSRVLVHGIGCPNPTACVCGHTSGPSAGEYYIRQDTATRKVWMYNASTNFDTIFLDFNLHVGDTIDARKAVWAPAVNSGPPFWIVSSIDSALIDGQYRKRFNYGCADYLIEGMVPSHGLYLANNCFEYQASLQYFEHHSHILVGDINTGYYWCHDFTTLIDELNQTSFSISPNPAHDKLNVECNLQNAELKIYDMTGREVLSRGIGNSKLEIGVEFSPGVYLVKVSDGKQQAVQKLIIE